MDGSCRKIFVGLFTLLFIGQFSVSVYGQCNFNQAPAGELCSSAFYICGSDLDGYTNTLPNTQSVQQQWIGLCNGSGSAQNIMWFSFTPCDSIVELEISVTSCYVFDTITKTSQGTHPNAGLQVGLFGSCNSGDWLDCSKSPSNPPGVTGVFRVKSNKFKPGTLGYLYLDGYNVSLTTLTLCSFSIKVISGISTSPVTPPDASKLSDGYITGPNSVSCEDLNKNIAYSLVEPERAVAFNPTCLPPVEFSPADSVCYAWNVSPSIGRQFANQDSTGKNVDLSFSIPGTYTITAETYFNPYYVGSCANVAAGKINSWTVTVLPPVHVTDALEFICPGEQRTFCGQAITKDTIIVCDQDPCRIVTKEFKVGTSKLNFLGTQYICAGGSFIFQGVSYTQAGTHDVVDNTDCTLLHRFTIEPISITSTISAPILQLDCNHPSLSLTGSATTNSNNTLDFEWRDINNNILSNNASLMVSQPGEYIFTATYKTPNGSCADWERVTITQDIDKPSFQAIVPLVRCRSAKDPKHVITIVTNEVWASAVWTKPLGGTQLGLNIEVDSLNAVSSNPYKFTAVGTNGCQVDSSFTIKTNFEKASIIMQGDDLTCYKPIQTLSVSTSIPIDSIRWSKAPPNAQFFGSYLSKMSHDVIEPGVYKVEVMASASKCWNDESLYIGENKTRPDLSLNNEVKWHCNTKSVDIRPNTSVGDHFRYTWNTNDGNILSGTSAKDLVAGSVGMYELVVFDTINGCSVSGMIHVVQDTFQPSRIFYQTHDVLCYGDENGGLQIQSVAGGYEPYRFYLDGLQLDQVNINDLAPGNYQLAVKDVYDCSHQLDFKIGEPSQIIVQTEPEITIAFTEVADLAFTCNYPDTEITNITWTNSKGEVLGNGVQLNFSSTTSDLVTVEVTNINGCTSRAQIKVNVDNELKMYFPNIFSPNGDNVNDRLVIGKNKIPAEINKISIFDRYGNLVFDQDAFEFNNDTEGWDGMANGSYVLPGVYIMMIELTGFDGRRQVIHKDLTIIR